MVEGLATEPLMALTNGAVAAFVAEVKHLIDLTRHLTQHIGVLVFDAQAQGFGAVHAVYYYWSNKQIQEKLWPAYVIQMAIFAMEGIVYLLLIFTWYS